MDTEHSDSLLDRVELIESQPLADRAAGFAQLHRELLQDLQRSDTMTTHSDQGPRGTD